MNEIQKCILNIYKEVAKICERNNLKYYAIGGTCIGVVRHEGFIPWDDDMDIAMPIEDFKKFRKIAEKELPQYLTLMDPEKTEHDYLMFLKVMDSRTTMTEEHFLNWKDTYEGVWLDIMPLGGIPDPGEERNKYLKTNKYYRRFNFKLRTDFKLQETLNGKIVYSLTQMLKPFVKYNYFFKKWLNHAQMYSMDNCNYTGYIWSDRIDKLIFPTDWFIDYVNMKFEDTEIRMPIGWDKMLTQMFGNYMVVPPKNLQEVHVTGHGIVDLKRSYKEYQKDN